MTATAVAADSRAALACSSPRSFEHPVRKAKPITKTVLSMELLRRFDHGGNALTRALDPLQMKLLLCRTTSFRKTPCCPKASYAPEEPALPDEAPERLASP